MKNKSNNIETTKITDKTKRAEIGNNINNLRTIIGKTLEDTGIHLDLIITKIKSGDFPTLEDYTGIEEASIRIHESNVRQRERKRRISGNETHTKTLPDKYTNPEGRSEGFYRSYMHKLEKGELPIDETTACALAYYFTIELSKIEEKDLPDNITVHSYVPFIGDDGAKEIVTLQEIDPRYFLLETNYINAPSQEKHIRQMKMNAIEISNALADSLIKIFNLSGYTFYDVEYEESEDTTIPRFKSKPKNELSSFTCSHPLIGKDSINHIYTTGDTGIIKEFLPFLQNEYIAKYENRYFNAISKDQFELLFNEIAEYAIFRLKMLLKSET